MLGSQHDELTATSLSYKYCKNCNHYGHANRQFGENGHLQCINQVIIKVIAGLHRLETAVKLISLTAVCNRGYHRKVRVMHGKIIVANVKKHIKTTIKIKSMQCAH